MHVDFWILAGLRKLCGQLGRFDDRAMGHVFASRVANDYVRSAIVSGVQPEVIRLSDLESQMVVVLRRATYQNLETIG